MAERWKNRERKYIKRRYGMRVDGRSVLLVANLIPGKKKKRPTTGEPVNTPV